MRTMVFLLTILMLCGCEKAPATGIGPDIEALDALIAMSRAELTALIDERIDARLDRPFDEQPVEEHEDMFTTGPIQLFDGEKWIQANPIDDPPAEDALVIDDVVGTYDFSINFPSLTFSSDSGEDLLVIKPPYTDPNNWHFDDSIIRHLASSGRICEVLGHPWREDIEKACDLVYRPHTLRMEICGICGLTREMTWEWKEE